MEPGKKCYGSNVAKLPTIIESGKFEQATPIRVAYNIDRRSFSLDSSHIEFPNDVLPSHTFEFSFSLSFCLHFFICISSLCFIFFVDYGFQIGPESLIVLFYKLVSVCMDWSNEYCFRIIAFFFRHFGSTLFYPALYSLR